MEIPSLIGILGPTACGKTALAIELARRIDGEIISADSRQVYRGMDIGTGKDKEEYRSGGAEVICHVIDVVDPDQEYNVYLFRKDFISSAERILERKKRPILCGGTGLYLEAILKNYDFQDIPKNQALADMLSKQSDQELERHLRSIKKLHNKTDLTDRSRMIKAIMIAEYMQGQPEARETINIGKKCLFGIRYERDTVRSRITERLEQRLANGMVEEVEQLMAAGISKERLLSFGLEYRFITQMLIGQITKEEMYERLKIAIHQFSKRQMTWFRGMERRGIEIKWIEGEWEKEQKIEFMQSQLSVENIV